MKVTIPAKLSKEQKLAIRLEVDKTYKERLLQHADKIDAMILWILYDKYNWTRDQLETFYHEYIKYYEELVKYYDLPDGHEFIAQYNLKEYAGIDIDAWNKEELRRINSNENSVNN